MELCFCCEARLNQTRNSKLHNFRVKDKFIREVIRKDRRTFIKLRMPIFYNIKFDKYTLKINRTIYYNKDEYECGRSYKYKFYKNKTILNKNTGFKKLIGSFKTFNWTRDNNVYELCTNDNEELIKAVKLYIREYTLYTFKTD